MFITKHGNPLDRSNIWRMMKRLCASAGVAAQKVFPHNLRHLFALTFYRKEKDIVRLADLLGHSSIETARIYTQASAESCSRALARLNLTLHRFPDAIGTHQQSWWFFRSGQSPKILATPKGVGTSATCKKIIACYP